MINTARGPFDVKLTPMTPDDESATATNVARMTIEKTFHGDLTFALQHSGVMTRGARGLTVTVVPDSGTGELAGLSGKMDIQIEGGKHSYELEYALP